MEADNKILTSSDLDNLIKALDKWEAMTKEGADFFSTLPMKVRFIGGDDDDLEAASKSFKTHCDERAKHFETELASLREQTIFLRAKLRLGKRGREDEAIEQLFEQAAVPVEPVVAPEPVVDLETKAKLERAEFFIRDMGKGVWTYYEEFLKRDKES
jgi:hypothetical protein